MKSVTLIVILTVIMGVAVNTYAYAAGSLNTCPKMITCTITGSGNSGPCYNTDAKKPIFNNWKGSYFGSPKGTANPNTFQPKFNGAMGGNRNSCQCTYTQTNTKTYALIQNTKCLWKPANITPKNKWSGTTCSSSNPKRCQFQ